MDQKISNLRLGVSSTGVLQGYIERVSLRALVIRQWAQDGLNVEDNIAKI